MWDDHTKPSGTLPRWDQPLKVSLNDNDGEKWAADLTASAKSVGRRNFADMLNRGIKRYSAREAIE